MTRLWWLCKNTVITDETRRYKSKSYDMEMNNGETKIIVKNLIKA